MYWKGREPSWKTGVIAQLSGKGTVESLLFGLVGHAQVYGSGSVYNLVGAMTGSRFVGVTPWPGGEWEKAYIVL